MGRSAPTLRMALRMEAERLRRLSRHVRDEGLRRALEEIAEKTMLLHDAFLHSPESDAFRVLVLSVLADLEERVSRLERWLKDGS